MSKKQEVFKKKYVKKQEVFKKVCQKTGGFKGTVRYQKDLPQIFYILQKPAYNELHSCDFE